MTYIQLGRTLYELKRFEQSIVAFKKSIKLDSRFNDNTFHNIGAACLNLNRVDEAVEYFKKSAELKKQDTTFLYNTSKILASYKKYA